MSEARTINFELVSPEEKLVSGPVKMAVIPGTTGEMGVGAGHSAFVVSLRPGVVRLTIDGAEGQNIFIAGGFADVTGEACVVLAEQAVPVNDLDQGKVEQELKDLNEDLGIAEDAVAKVRVRKKIAVTKAKLTALTGKIAL